MKKLTFFASTQLLDPLAGVLFESGVEGLQEEAGRLIAYVDDEDEEQRLLDLAHRFSESQEGDDEVEAFSEEIDDSWQDTWQQALTFVPLTERWVLRPTHQSPAPEQEETIWFQPQASFGDGSHPTTQLAARAVSAWIHGRGSDDNPSCRILDVGAGNGVLSLLAIKEADLCGVAIERLLAVDIDEVAINSLKQNLSLNQLDPARIEVRLGVLGEESSNFDLVVANINTPIISELAPLLIRSLAPGGTLLLTGLLTCDETEMTTRYQDHRVSLERREHQQQWCLLSYRAVS